MKDKYQIQFFCEAGLETGFGHAGRCIALATVIRDVYGCECVFVFRGSEAAMQKIHDHGFKTILTEDFNSYHFKNESAVILDLRVPLSTCFFSRARKTGAVVATIDDPTPNRLQCDIAFYPPVPQFHRLDWEGFSGKIYRGWNFIPLRKEFCLHRNSRTRIKDNSEPEILITMGGSDPHGLTLKTISALRNISCEWKAKIIIGPLFNDLDKVKRMALEHKDRIILLQDIKDMASEMSKSDLAVASFGMTAYELAACAVPQILLSCTEDHALSASALHDSKAAISMGIFDRVTKEDLTEKLQELITDTDMRERMTKKAQKLKIADGASNISAIIMKHLEQEL